MVTLSDKHFSRVVIVQILYMFKLSDHDIELLTSEKIEQYIQDLAKFYQDDVEGQDISARIRVKFVKTIVLYLAEHIEIIDQNIIAKLTNKQSWERMHILIKAILRAAIAEKSASDTSKNVIIDEYMKIAISFFSHKEAAFVNATLDKIFLQIAQ